MSEGVSGRPDVVEALAGLLQYAELQVRAAAVVALGKMGGAAGCRPGIMRDLMRVVGDKIPSVRLAAFDTLRTFDEEALRAPEVVEVLVELMQHTQPMATKASASKLHLDLSRRAKALLRRQRGQKRPAEADP